MSLQFRTTERNAWLTTLNTALGASAKLFIYSGGPPATVAAGPTGVLLSSGAVGNAAGWGSVASGVLTAAAITSDASAVASGTAGYFRWLDSSNNVICQGTVTATGGGGDLTMNSISIIIGDTIAITSWTITAPGA